MAGSPPLPPSDPPSGDGSNALTPPLAPPAPSRRPPARRVKGKGRARADASAAPAVTPKAKGKRRRAPSPDAHSSIEDASELGDVPSMAWPRQIPTVQISVVSPPRKVAKGEVHVALGKVRASVTYRAAQLVSYCLQDRCDPCKERDVDECISQVRTRPTTACKNCASIKKKCEEPARWADHFFNWKNTSECWQLMNGQT
jgi:hypothetical protein